MLISNNAGIELHTEVMAVPTDPNSVLVRFYSIGENLLNLDDRFNKFEFIATKAELNKFIQNLQKNLTINPT